MDQVLPTALEIQREMKHMPALLQPARARAAVEDGVTGEDGEDDVHTQRGPCGVRPLQWPRGERRGGEGSEDSGWRHCQPCWRGHPPQRQVHLGD